MDWQEQAVAHWATINALAIRRFGRGSLAEEAALAVFDGLKADDWRRLRAYSGRAKLSTFIKAVALRLLEDFARTRFGRIRPPLWVRSLGGLWRQLFTALCLERLGVADAVERLGQGERVASTEQIETAAYELLARIPECGKHQGLEVSLAEDDLADQVPAGRPIEERLELREKKELLRAVFQLILGEEEAGVSGRALAALNRLTIDLSPTEKLLLKLCYQDGRDVTAAGRLLGLNRFQAHGLKRRLLERLKTAFEKAGLADELRLLLEP